MASDIYKEIASVSLLRCLAYDIFANTPTDLAQAANIVDWLEHEGLLDYDNLKEYYDEDA